MGSTWEDRGYCVYRKDTATGVESYQYLSDEQRSMKKSLVSLGYVFCAFEKQRLYGKFSKGSKTIYVSTNGCKQGTSSEDWDYFENVIKEEYKKNGFEFQCLLGDSWLKFARMGGKIFVDNTGHLFSNSGKNELAETHAVPSAPKNFKLKKYHTKYLFQILDPKWLKIKNT
jgi:hypothetical protein